MFKKESLEALRQRVDLIDVLTSHVELKRAGAYYKGRCPFHDEKSPSFMVQRGDSHYHCYGCGAHGDAIEFLMNHLNLGFVDAVENLAERFKVSLERTSERENTGPDRAELRKALAQASEFYQRQLLESKEALEYLKARGLNDDFIRRFQLGLAPSGRAALATHLKDTPRPILDAAGLVRKGRDFFSDRILFPICDATGSVIGFSGRKYKEETHGGKYVNTPETPLFHKSRVLFGLHLSRRRIAKERRAVIVEGQIDALRLIHAGVDVAVAGQGTAFGEGQVQELLRLGVQTVYLALDGDQAGRDAAAKIGNLFQKEGVGVQVALLPEGSDPDQILNSQGIQAIFDFLKGSIGYLPFMVELLSKTHDVKTPAGKSALVKQLSDQIRSWSEPVMVHESLRRLAELVHVPEEVMGVQPARRPHIHSRASIHGVKLPVSLDEVIEADVLRWLIFMGENDPWFADYAQEHLEPADFHVLAFRQIFEVYFQQEKKDLLSLAIGLEDDDTLTQLLRRKINKDRAKEQYPQSVLKLLERNWMQQREAITQKIQSNVLSDEQMMDATKAFDRLTKNPPAL